MEWKYQHNRSLKEQQQREALYQKFWQQTQPKLQQQQAVQQLSQQLPIPVLPPVQQQQQQQQEQEQSIPKLQNAPQRPALSKRRKQRINEKKRDNNNNNNNNNKLPTTFGCVVNAMASASVAVFMGVVGVAFIAADL